jgi:predicted O-methyltransferase YrrM
MAKKRYPNRVEVLHGPSVEMAKRVEDGSLDFVFIDADHRYEFVVEDIKAWFPKVRSGGTLCGHDYGDPRFPGVEKAVKEYFHTYGTTKRHGIWYVTKINGAWLQ